MTGRGINFTADPILVAPMITSSTPAIIVHMNNPSTPCAATMAATTTTKAPVGPPICVFEPRSKEIRETGYDGAVNTRLRCEAGGDGKCHSQRQSDQPHGDASHQIVRTLLQAVVAQTEDRLGQPLVRKANAIEALCQSCRLPGGVLICCLAALVVSYPGWNRCTRGKGRDLADTDNWHSNYDCLHFAV